MAGQWLRVAVIWLIFVAGMTLGRAVPPSAMADPPLSSVPIVSIRSNPQFADVRIELQQLVNAFGFHEVNHFCIITYAPPPGDNFLIPFIYWPTQNKYIGWHAGSNPTIVGGDIEDLTRDVVAENVDQGSTYLLRRPWVNEFLPDCMKRGDHYTIRKTIGGWVSIAKFPQFSSVRSQLQFIVDNDTSKKRSDFCVIGQKDGAYLAAYVYWKTKDMLFMWFPDKDDIDDPFAVSVSLVQIDLKHYLRDEEDAEAEQNEEMQKSYAEAVLAACKASGENFSMSRSK